MAGSAWARIFPTARVAEVYFWRARPGMLPEYNRYIREVAEPTEQERHRAGACPL